MSFVPAPCPVAARPASVVRVLHMPPVPTSMKRLSRERLIDVGLCVLLLLLAVPMHEREGVTAAETAILVAAAVGLILTRRRHPIATLAAGLGAAVVVTAWVDRPTVLLPATVVLLYHAAASTNRRTALCAAAAGIVTYLVCVLILGPHDPLGPELLAGLAWPTLATAAGDAARSRAQVMAAAIERAERAEITREEEARRRVAEERLHIARELHDLVAHNIAVVSVQAGVAEHFVTVDPEAATGAIRNVRAAAQSVLDELSGILSVLRSGDADDAPTVPTPTVEAIPALIESFTAAGLDVTYETTGDHHALSGPAALAAYRMVQEALANAHKHGDGTVRLRIAYAPDGLHIRIDNPLGTAQGGAPPGWGYGLIGMRERVTAAGGVLTTEIREQAFHLDARLPYADAGARSSSPDGREAT